MQLTLSRAEAVNGDQRKKKEGKNRRESTSEMKEGGILSAQGGEETRFPQVETSLAPIRRCKARKCGDI